MWQGTFANDELPNKFMFGHTKERGLLMVTRTRTYRLDGTGEQIEHVGDEHVLITGKERP